MDNGAVLYASSSNGYYAGVTEYIYGARHRLYSLKKPSLICGASSDPKEWAGFYNAEYEAVYTRFNGLTVNNNKKYSVSQGNLSYPIGTLTADEIVYAGGDESVNNANYYLINDYQTSNSKWFWSLSPSYFRNSRDDAFFVGSDGILFVNGGVSSGGHVFRPSVSLKSSAVITSGEGTLEKPYIIG